MKNSNAAIGVVRLELRASKQKLDQLARKYKIVSPKKNYTEFLGHAPDITEQEIPKVVSKMVGSANFRTYQCVKDKILNSEYKDSYKQRMLDVVNYLSKHTSGQKLLETLHLEQHDWKKLVKRFNEIGCSPIPVSRTYKRYVYPGVSVWDVNFK